ncbi:UPF0489 family protein [Caldithrix abyssi]
MDRRLFQQAKELYRGFYITQPVGNNAFSFAQRQHKKIFVPPLQQGTLSDVQIGDEIVFVEIEEGVEHPRTGLKNFVYWPYQNKPVFIFDNHNHAFFFWLLGYLSGIVKPHLQLVHVDQHTDVWEPEAFPPFSLQPPPDLKEVFHYTNYRLNVGTFIKPALQLNLFSDLQIVNTSAEYGISFNEPIVLDIDLDIFAPGSSVIEDREKIRKVREWIEQAVLITIATSPFFIDQQLALHWLNEIFNM